MARPPSRAGTRRGMGQDLADRSGATQALDRARYELAVRRQILPTWCNVPLGDVAYADVATWVQRLAASHLAPASVRYAHRVLSLILEDAVRDGRLARNPAQGVRLPRVIESQKLFLSHDQVADLAANAGPYGTLVNVLAYTGLRWGETAALPVGRVQLTRRRLEIVEASSEVRGEIISPPRPTNADPCPSPGLSPSHSLSWWTAKHPRTWSSPPRTGTCCATPTSAAGCSTPPPGPRVSRD